MSDLSVTLRKSRIFHDRSGECWILLHVPSDADTGELCSTLWEEYCRFLEGVHEEFGRSNTIEDCETVFSGVLK